MSAEHATSQEALSQVTLSKVTPDVIGLTKVAPLSRRDFMAASAAVTAGYTLAAGPVRADEDAWDRMQAWFRQYKVLG